MAETIPTTVPEVEADLCYSAPNPPPTQWAEYIRKKLDPRLFEIYTANRVPWQILKTMADDLDGRRINRGPLPYSGSGTRKSRYEPTTREMGT